MAEEECLQKSAAACRSAGVAGVAEWENLSEGYTKGSLHRCRCYRSMCRQNMHSPSQDLRSACSRSALLDIRPLMEDTRLGVDNSQSMVAAVVGRSDSSSGRDTKYPVADDTRCHLLEGEYSSLEMLAEEQIPSVAAVAVQTLPAVEESFPGPTDNPPSLRRRLLLKQALRLRHEKAAALIFR